MIQKENVKINSINWLRRTCKSIFLSFFFSCDFLFCCRSKRLKSSNKSQCVYEQYENAPNAETDFFFFAVKKKKARHSVHIKREIYYKSY